MNNSSGSDAPCLLTLLLSGAGQNGPATRTESAPKRSFIDVSALTGFAEFESRPLALRSVGARREYLTLDADEQLEDIDGRVRLTPGQRRRLEQLRRQIQRVMAARARDRAAATQTLPPSVARPRSMARSTTATVADGAADAPQDQPTKPQVSFHFQESASSGPARDALVRALAALLRPKPKETP